MRSKNKSAETKEEKSKKQPTFLIDLFLRIKRQPTPVHISLGMIVLSFVSLIFSISFMLSITSRLNMDGIEPQAGQLLNRDSIEEASSLLQNTVSFTEEQ